MGEGVNTISKGTRQRNGSDRLSGEDGLRKAAKAAYKAFHSKGVERYFNGGGNPSSNAKAYDKYQKALADFKKAWNSVAGSRPAFNDYFQAMNEVVDGTVFPK